MKLKKPLDKQHYHWHHIIPRYMGGSNEPDNLILLSPLEHALAHLKRYEDYKNPADLYAAKILMGSLGEEGVPVDMSGIKRPQFSGKNNPACKPGVGAKISAAKKGIPNLKARGRVLSEEVKEKMRKPKGPRGTKTIGSSGMRWWNDGKDTKFQKESPGEDWKLGRLNDPWTEERRAKISATWAIKSTSKQQIYK